MANNISWEWQELDGKCKDWITFGAALSREIEFGYSHSKDPTFKIPSHFDRFGSRTISFTTMQLCRPPGDERLPLEVRSLEKAETKGIAGWYWVEKNNHILYEEKDKDVLEEGFQRNEDKIILGEKYEIDFNSMTQINIKTRFTRPILRITTEKIPFSCRKRVFLTPLYNLVTRPIKGILSTSITKLKNLKLSGFVEIEFSSNAAHSWQIRSNDLFREEPSFPTSTNKVFDICGKPDDTLNFTLYQYFIPSFFSSLVQKEFVGVLEIPLMDVRNGSLEGWKPLTYQKKRDDQDAQLHFQFSFQSLVEETKRTITVRHDQKRAHGTKVHQKPLPTKHNTKTKTLKPLHTSAALSPSMNTNISTVPNSIGPTEPETELINFPQEISPKIEVMEIPPIKQPNGNQFCWDQVVEEMENDSPKETYIKYNDKDTNEENEEDINENEEEDEFDSNEEDINDFYDFGDNIGSGSFAQIFKATDKSEGTEVAIKQIPTEQIMTKTELASLELEITIMNFLGIAEEQCDYCLSSITSFDTAEFVYIVMPLAKCSILDIINKKQDNGLNSSEAATVMFGLLEAIQYLHKKSICHRDIKPENILVMDESDLKQCKLSDYGSSHNLNDGPMSQLVGTETYMAPEMLMGSYTPAVDYWSAGVVAYVLITACLPWKTDKSITVQIMEQQDWAPFEQKVESRKLDQSVVPFVKGLMQKDVNQRWDPETALNHNWIKENYPL